MKIVRAFFTGLFSLAVAFALWAFIIYSAEIDQISEQVSAYIEDIATPTPSPIPTPYSTPAYEGWINSAPILIKLEEGTVYGDWEKEVAYIPNNVRPNCDVMVFWPGGSGHNSLYIEDMPFYLPRMIHNNDVSAVILMSGSSHYYDNQRLCCQVMLDWTKEIMQELNIDPDKISVTGASLGAYTAILFGQVLYENGFDCYSISTYSTGYGWNPDIKLPEITYSYFNNMGTKFYILEAIGFTNKAYDKIGGLSECEDNIYIIECKTGGHDAIVSNALLNGVMMFAMDEKETLKDGAYFIYKLTDN